MNLDKWGIEEIEEVVKKYPNSAYAHNKLGNAYCFKSVNRYYGEDNAIACYKKAIEINPNYAVAYRDLGNAYFQRNNYIENNDARDAYKKAYELAKQNSNFINNYGYFLDKQQILEAMKLYKQIKLT